MIKAGMKEKGSNTWAGMTARTMGQAMRTMETRRPPGEGPNGISMGLGIEKTVMMETTLIPDESTHTVSPSMERRRMRTAGQGANGISMSPGVGKKTMMETVRMLNENPPITNASMEKTMTRTPGERVNGASMGKATTAKEMRMLNEKAGVTARSTENRRWKWIMQRDLTASFAGSQSIHTP
jgi:hypothetical protein